MTRKPIASAKRQPARRTRRTPAIPAAAGTAALTPAPGEPHFAQPAYTPDPARFRVTHGSDTAAYRILDANRNPQPIGFPAPRGGVEPVLSLADAWGPAGPGIEQTALKAGQIVFHAVGDTGNTRSTAPQNAVADKLAADFSEPEEKDVPRFFLHLGDVVYSFGEARYYYDQFYEPYRTYPAPIIALAGNHDGMVEPGSTVPTLDAFLRNFCATEPVRTDDAGGLDRTAMIQPGVFFTLEAPFVRVLCLYSNILEDPGVISSQGKMFPDVTNAQIDYLTAALTRARRQRYQGAIIIAHHHPVYTAGDKHGASPLMRTDIDRVCNDVGVWPHAVLSGHAHNYQRFTRVRGKTQIPYIIAGGGGHGLGRLGVAAVQQAIRTPVTIPDPTAGGDTIVLENYDDQNYGYLRLLVTASQLRIEYHPASDGARAATPDDFVTVDLKTRTLVHFTGVSN